MKELSPLEKLDAVLKALEKHHSEKHHDLISMQQILDIEYPQVKFGETFFILKKLVKDGYLDAKDVKIPNTETLNTYYLVNFDGRIFNQLGGYTKREKIINSELNTAKLLNWAIAISGGMAAIYYLLEILKSYIIPLFQSCSTSYFRGY